MKVLINKHNPAIRITAPEIESYREFYTLQDKDFHYLFKMDDWTLVEEKPTIVETIKEFVEKGERCMQQAVEDQNPGNYTFWDGFHNCAENILREVEEPTEGIKGNLEEISSNVSIEEEPEKQTSKYFKKPDYDKQVVKKMSKELAKIITDQIVEPVDLEKLALEKYPIQVAYLEGLKKGYELGLNTRNDEQGQQEVDLEKEIDKTVSECTSGYNFDWDRFARHFYELGKKGGSK